MASCRSCTRLGITMTCTSSAKPAGYFRTTTMTPVAAALLALSVSLLPLAAASARAESCTTQSSMQPADRDAIATAARNLAAKVAANDAASLRTSAAADLAKDFGALQYMIAITAPKLTNDTPTVEQVYILDATSLKSAAAGATQEAQFFCSLNNTTQEVQFDIAGLSPGRYAFAIVRMTPNSSGTAAPWRLSFLMRQDPPSNGPWLLAGLYPKPLTAAGHEGLWFWTQARQFAKDKQPWNAWLYYQEAIKLLQPADFLNSTHLDKLRTEASSAAPPQLSGGIGPDTPLVVKSSSGTEFRFTSLAVDDSAGSSTLDLTAHIRVDPLPDQNAARQRNEAAAAALLGAYPEFRKPFHGVSIIADTPGQPPYASEQPMADIK